MTEDEKKAIYRCNELIKNKHKEWIGISNQIAIETLLNLIEKQRKEIEKKDKEWKQLFEEYNNRVEEIIDLKNNSVPKEAIRSISNHIEYYLIGNLRYKDSQDILERLLKKLKEILGE